MDKLCPLMAGPCLEHKCKWFIKLLGNNPQTGVALKEEEDCVIAFLPILLIEGTQQTRQAGAAVESMRNEIVRRMDHPLVCFPGLPAQDIKSLEG